MLVRMALWLALVATAATAFGAGLQSHLATVNP